MKKIYEDSEIETTAEEKLHGLRRIKRTFRPKKGEMTLRDCQVITEIRIDADLYTFLETESNKTEDLTIENLLNSILRERFEKEEVGKLAEIKELRNKLLNDKDFLQELKEKLAA